MLTSRLCLRIACLVTFASVGCGETPLDSDEGPSLRADAASSATLDASVSMADAAREAGANPAHTPDASAPTTDPLDAAQFDPGSGADATLRADAGDMDAGPARSSDAAAAADTGRFPIVDATLDAAVPSDASPQTPSDASGDAATPGPSSPRSVTVTDANGAAVKRTFLLYVPSSVDKSTPVPLVSVHHGFTMSGKVMEEISSWKRIAERERFVVAFPDGGDYLGPWNVGENVCDIGAVVAGAPAQDDFGFVKALIEDAHARQPIDKTRVFVAGFSMGGYFANNVGCKARTVVRAVSAHSGGTYTGDCPDQPVPVLVIHGDADGLIPLTCGQQARSLWVTRNGCSTQSTTEPIKNGSCEWNQGCPAGKEVGMCTFKGMDHGWAGAPTSGPGAWLTAPLQGNLGYGGGVQYEDAAELMWRFFATYL